MPVELICKICGKTFKVRPCLASTSIVCSMKCAGEWHSKVMTGHPHYGGGHRFEKGCKASGGFETRFKKGLKPWNVGLSYKYGPNTEEQKKKKHDAALKRNKNPEYLKHLFKSMNMKPNKPEKFVINLINKHSLPFSYVGDGQKIIGNLNPDFIHNNGENKVIEVFGRVYHDPECAFFPVHKNAQLQNRVNLFKENGYDCLVLWDDELKEESTLNKIISFGGT